jgi:hypothetical protein
MLGCADMKIAMLAAALFATAVPAHAQTEGRVSVGASTTFIAPADSDVESTVGFGPLVRLNPRKGWGFAGAFNWVQADLNNPSGAAGAFARLRVRPLMAGVAYSIQKAP